MRSSAPSQKIKIIGHAVLLTSLILSCWIVFTSACGSKSGTPSVVPVGLDDAIADPVQFTKDRFTGGIGAALTMDGPSGLPKVHGVISNSPAESAGLRAGDIFIEIDGKATKGQTLVQTVEQIRGLTVANVNLVIQRDGTNVQFVVDRTSWNNLRKIGNFK